jgi:preprotein translocase subunit YajC
MSLLQAVVPVSIVLVVLLLIIGAVLAFFSARKTKAQKEFFAELHKNLKPGKIVMFCGGIKGKVKRLVGDFAHIEVADGVVIEVSRYAIQQILED